MKVVIMGCGQVGATLAVLLDSKNHEVTIMDVNPDSFSRLSTTFKGTAWLGDGTDEDSLREAGVETADAFVAVTENDNLNAMSAQIVKLFFKVPRVICRIYDPLRGELYQSLGLEVISFTTVFTQLLEEKLMEPRS